LTLFFNHLVLLGFKFSLFFFVLASTPAKKTLLNSSGGGGWGFLSLFFMKKFEILRGEAKRVSRTAEILN